MKLKNFGDKFITSYGSQDSSKETLNKALEIVNFEMKWSNENLENVVACVEKIFM